MNSKQNSTAGQCPVMHGANTAVGKSNMDWWPKALNLDILHQHDTQDRIRWAPTSTTARR